jgi:hypothetical protein
MKVAAAAREASEKLLETFGWPPDTALSRAHLVERLHELHVEEGRLEAEMTRAAAQIDG